MVSDLAGGLGPVGSPEAAALTNPFALVPAPKWGVLLSVVLVASAATRA